MRSAQTDRELYLEDELERYRRNEETANAEFTRQREDRRRELDQRFESNMRSADNWLDALRQQSYLTRREANSVPSGDPPEDDYFFQTAAACDEGIRLWPEEQARVAEEIARLQAQIDDLNNSIRRAVGRKIAELHPTTGGRDVATTLLDPDASIESFLNW